MSFGRSGSCSGLRRRSGRQTPAHPTLRCDSARWRAWPVDDWAAGTRHIFGGRRERTGERYQPVLVPQLGQDLVNGLNSSLVAGLGQVGIDGGGSRRSMSQISLNNPQIEPGFQ